MADRGALTRPGSGRVFPIGVGGMGGWGADQEPCNINDICAESL